MGRSAEGEPWRPAPPLSLGLRDFGSPISWRPPAPSAGRRHSWSSFGAPLSSVHQLAAVLLPERFRGGCAFGSGPFVEGPISPARVGRTLLYRWCEVNAAHRLFPLVSNATPQPGLVSVDRDRSQLRV